MAEEERLFCRTFRPTKEEFSQPFCDYVQEICRKNPDVAMFKVIPPVSWAARRERMPDLEEMRIETPIRQHVFGTGGVFRSILEEQKSLSAADFKRIAHNLHRTPPKGPRKDELLERAFWSSVTANPPLYGADNPTSLFDKALDYGWNLNDLGDLLKKYNVASIPGVTTPMVYFGMWKSFFSWHVEDVDLYSINYLHFGEPKVWYCVSPADRTKFESMAKSLFPELHNICPAFLRHKDILLSPKKLRSHQIRYVQAKQEAGEFIVLNAGAYHSGFNLGFNCAEAVNFATEDWLATGKEATQCSCSALPDHVTLDMKVFSRGTRISQRLKAASANAKGAESSEDDSDIEDDSAGPAVGSSDSEEEASRGIRKRKGGADAKKGPSHGASRKSKQKSRSLNELSQPSPKRARLGMAVPAKDLKKQAQVAALETLSNAAAGKSQVQKNHGKHQELKGAPSPQPSRAQRKSPQRSRLQPQQQSKTAQPAARNALAKLGAARGHRSKRLAGQPPELPVKAKRQKGSPKDRMAQSSNNSMQAEKPSSVSRAYKWMLSLVSPNNRTDCRTLEAPTEAHEEDKLAVFAVAKDDLESGQRLFYLVQKLKKRARRRHHVVVRCMEEGLDRVFRPADKTWEETEDALLPVVLQTCTAEGQDLSPQARRYRLLASESMTLGTVKAV